MRNAWWIKFAQCAVCVLFAGCAGLIDDGGGVGLTAEELHARQVWTDKAMPVITQSCLSCHVTTVGYEFVAGGDVLAKRTTILNFTPAVVNLEAIPSSRLLVKGQHEGPPLTAQQLADLLEWLNAEQEAVVAGSGDPTPQIQTERFRPTVCDQPPAGSATCQYNRVPLDDIGAAGAQLEFLITRVGSGMYMTEFKLVPGAAGAYIEHPLFVTYPPGEDPKPDTLDRYFDVKKNLTMGVPVEDQIISGGSAGFVGFSTGDEMNIHFKKVDVFEPDETGVVAVGCKMLGDFKAVRQAFTTTQAGLGQSCLSCHGGGDPNATIVVNMTGADSADDAMVQKACDSIRPQLNFQTFDQSGIFLAPDPGNNNHPVRFGTAANLTSFKNLLMPWFTAEQTAP